MFFERDRKFLSIGDIVLRHSVDFWVLKNGHTWQHFCGIDLYLAEQSYEMCFFFIPVLFLKFKLTRKTIHLCPQCWFAEVIGKCCFSYYVDVSRVLKNHRARKARREGDKAITFFRHLWISFINPTKGNLNSGAYSTLKICSIKSNAEIYQKMRHQMVLDPKQHLLEKRSRFLNL